MSSLIFLDTSGWIALLNAKDQFHEEANQVWRRTILRGGSFVITDWVVAETRNGLARFAERAKFVESYQRLHASSRGRFVEVADTYLDSALSLYRSRSDKNWGLVDCASFEIMADLGISQAFTLDHHFEQAGFQRLLGGPSG